MGLFLTGCEDFLDSEPTNLKTIENYPATQEDADQVLTGIYSVLAMPDPLQTSFLSSELRSDNLLGGGGPTDISTKAIAQCQKWSESSFAVAWRTNYMGIFRANVFLEALDKVEWNSEEDRKRMEGEARFLRAHYYFDLSRMFGDVCLITTSESVNIPRTPAAETYAFIAADLKKAIEDLLPTERYDAVESGRVTKWAAQALMARVFLFYTGYYQQESMPLPDNSTLSRTDVITYLDDCINNSGHDLIGDFRNLWPYSNVYTKKDYKYAQDNDLHWIGEDGANVETVFAIRYSAKATWDNPWYNNEVCLYSSPREPANLDDIFPFGIGWGIGTVNSRLWESWPSKDIRREASILSVEKEMPDYGWGCDKQMNETGYWQKKYMAVNAYNEDGESVNYSRILYPEIDSDYQLNNTQDLVIIRFADVLLMAAELKRDAAPMNRVRARVGLDPVTYSDEALRDERHWELAFEGLRYYDLLRWGIAAEVLSQQNGVKVLDNMVETRMDMGDIAQRLQATKGLMPLPKTQIDLSAGILEQNPGWGNESNMN